MSFRFLRLTTVYPEFAERFLRGVRDIDSIGYAEVFSAEFGLLGEQLALVDTGAADCVIAGPSAQHLARTAAEIEDTCPRFQTQRRAKSGELLGGEGIVDAVSTFGDGKDPWNVHCSISLQV